MTRPLILGLLGGVIIVAAIVLNFVIDGDDPVNSTTTSSERRSTEAPADTSLERPTFDIVRINPEGDTVMAGRAKPGARVQILDGDKVIGEVTADARGEWVFVPSSPLPPGNRQLSLRMIEEKDSPPVESEANVVLVVPEKGKDIAGRPTDEASQSLAVKVPRDGTGPSQVLQKPGGDTAESFEVTVGTVDYDTQGMLSVTGTGKPGGRVHLYLNNEFIGRSDIDGAGRWQFSPKEPLSPGVYTVRADQVADDGKVLGRMEVVFARSKPLTDVPPGSLIVVQPGNSLWRIAQRTYGDGFRFTVIYDANKNQIRDADLIYPGQVFRLPPAN